MRAALALLTLLALAPTAAAQADGAARTLASFEEPHEGTDETWRFNVTSEEADKPRALIFRNAPRAAFGIAVIDSGGREIFTKDGTRGVQTLPPLAAGEYNMLVRGAGEFQITEKAFERLLNATSVDTTLEGTDAYILAPTRAWLVNVTGDVRAEWWPLVGAPEELTPPFGRIVTMGGAWILTLRGEEGASYGVTLTPAEAPAPTPEAQTPGAPLAALLVGVAGVAFALRRKR